MNLRASVPLDGLGGDEPPAPMLLRTLFLLLACAPQQTVTTVCEWPQPWILRAQRGDGSWSTCDVPAELPGVHAGDPADDLWVSSLATLSLLADGHEEHRARAAQAVGWIGTWQQPDGRFALRASSLDLLDHAVATLALCEQLVARGTSAQAGAAARALEWLADRALSHGGWSRTGDPAGRLDARTTAWAALALASGRDAGFEIDVRLEADAAGALRCLHAHAEEVAPRDRASELLVRLLAGESPRMVALERAVRELLAIPPPAAADGAGHDPETVFLSTLVAQISGGAHWRAWTEELTGLLRRLRNLSSRDPRRLLLCDPARTRGGSAAAASLDTLTLELYFRYAWLPGVRGGVPRAHRR